MPGTHEATPVSVCASGAIVPVMWVMMAARGERSSESAPGRPAGQAPEVAQLLLASRGNRPLEFQSDLSPFNHAADYPVAHSVPAAGFADFLKKRPRGRAARHPRHTLFDPDDEGAPRL